MTLVVVPFHDGKSRLSSRRHVRHKLGLAMLADVLAACVALGETVLVTSDADAAAEAAELRADHVEDPGGGQSAAVTAALSGRAAEPVLVVNADVPAVTPGDLRSLLAATPSSGVALVEAADGTTNALSLPAPHVFAPLYGPGSGERFLRHARSLGLPAVSVPVPSIRDDVDTRADLERLEARLGPRTQAALVALERELVS